MICEFMVGEIVTAGMKFNDRSGLPVHEGNEYRVIDISEHQEYVELHHVVNNMEDAERRMVLQKDWYRLTRVEFQRVLLLTIVWRRDSRLPDVGIFFSDTKKG